MTFDWLEFLACLVPVWFVISTYNENSACYLYPNLSGSQYMTSRVKGYESVPYFVLLTKRDALDLCFFAQP